MTDVLVVAALDEEIAELRARHPELPVLVTGPGKVLAACALAQAVASDPPGAVLALGTAGAVDASVTGVLEVGEVAQHDFDATAIASLVGRDYGGPISLERPGVALATGDVFVDSTDEVARLAARGFVLVDMEGYAYAHVCRAAGVPIRIVKAVSDAADETAAVSWSDNVARCGAQLADWYDEHVAARPR